LIYRISELRLELDGSEKDLKKEAAKRLRVAPEAVRSLTPFRKSVDARKKDDVHFVCTVEVDCPSARAPRDRRVSKAIPYRYELPVCRALERRPVVVGFGPAGMFAALILAQAGQRPIVLERGSRVEERERRVSQFWRDGTLDPECNVQFGEGGAGTFSDGKLNTGTKDPRIRKVLEEFVSAGAPPEILYEAKPHIGTDRLPRTVRGIRERILSLGGTIRFGARMTALLQRDGRVSGVEFREKDGGAPERLETEAVVLAVGHSARDTFEHLLTAGVPMEPKAFAVGARIEHPQGLIDAAQYGKFAGHPALGAADYKLSVHLESGRGVYTFCMCPGGQVVAAASEPGRLATNGMSRFARDGENANAALLVGVGPGDFGADGPLAGVAFQRRLEEAAFRLGGGKYRAPVQRVEDFLERRASVRLGDVQPTYRPGVTPCSLDDCLPDFIADSMREGLRRMDARLRGFALPDAVLTAVESRSSSPVRILRGENGQSPVLPGLYPCGEGAGYAGGIVSAAVDGIKCAERILTR
jgi:uncharacterized FAD-dependent dehydrogenase